MQHPRSSQPQSSHHHTSEHSNFWTIILHGSHRSIGQTTHCQKPGPIPANVRTSTKTSTRIQTHQNLFTLTKNIFAPLNNSAGSKHPTNPEHPLHRVTFQIRRNTIFPITFKNHHQNQPGGDGRNRTDDPLLAKQVLYQLSYIPHS